MKDILLSLSSLKHLWQGDTGAYFATFGYSRCHQFYFYFFIGRVYSNRILTPLQHILKELKRIRANNLNVRLRSYGNKDELDQLIVSLNGMLDRIDTAFKSEKSFVSNASHELNNPLTAIQGECEIALLKERSTSEYMDSLERISVESKRISLLIKSLLFYPVRIRIF